MAQNSQWQRDDTCRTKIGKPTPQTSEVPPSTSNQPAATIVPFPQPDFSERFTSGSRFGFEGIPRPCEMFRRLQAFTGDSEFDLDPSLDTTPLSGVAEELPSVLEGVINDVTSVIHHKELVPVSVADAIEWLLADIAMIGILAEATWRTQHEEDSHDLRSTYIQHITGVFSELKLDDLNDVDLENLKVALNVGTRVLNEIFQFEICPHQPPHFTAGSRKNASQTNTLSQEGSK